MSEEGKADGPARVLAEIGWQETLQLLRDGEMNLLGLLPRSTNYTFLVFIHGADLESFAVYKPQQGERPLWDFPSGTLCLREYAAFLVSAALGWRLVPPTVLRDGPYGQGMVQLHIDARPDEHYFSFREQHTMELQRLAAFDCVVNNADRKAGHCLLDKDGRLWAVDHGLTFHPLPKLRTVIWDFAGEPIAEGILGEMRSLLPRPRAPDPLQNALGALLSAEEMLSFRQRVSRLLERGLFPQPGQGPSIPWPPV